jgi:hypothetical protein
MVWSALCGLSHGLFALQYHFQDVHVLPGMPSLLGSFCTISLSFILACFYDTTMVHLWATLRGISLPGHSPSWPL